jgi:hypothetical protein
MGSSGADVSVVSSVLMGGFRAGAWRWGRACAAGLRVVDVLFFRALLGILGWQRRGQWEKAGESLMSRNVILRQTQPSIPSTNNQTSSFVNRSLQKLSKSFLKSKGIYGYSLDSGYLPRWTLKSTISSSNIR